MNIIAFGDIHYDLNGIPRIEREISAADLVIISGDITNFGGINEARTVLDKIISLNPNILAISGNLDKPEVERWLSQGNTGINGGSRNLEGLSIFGCGSSNPSPFNTPNEKSEEHIEEVLNKAYASTCGDSVKILVSHAPPHNSALDRISSGIHVGSQSVRKFIEEKQPNICVCGHIHEAAGEETIGKTLVINPGPLAGGGYVDINFDKGEISAKLRFAR